MMANTKPTDHTLTAAIGRTVKVVDIVNLGDCYLEELEQVLAGIKAIATEGSAIHGLATLGCNLAAMNRENLMNERVDADNALEALRRQKGGA